jgi:hypothetical protein
VTADADTEEAVCRTVAICSKLRPYTVGDFYALFPHTNSEEAWFGYRIHRPDLNTGAAILFRRGRVKDPRMPVPLHAVVPKRSHEVSFEDTSEKQTAPGSACRHCRWRFRLPRARSSFIIRSAASHERE